MVRSGASSPARVRASARISRPSASVLPTSIDRPLREASTSPGRMASAEMAFSTAGISTTSRIGTPASMIMEARPSAWAAPPMSFFIQRMPDEGLMSSPPVSNTTPLPTRATSGASGPAPGADQVSSNMRGARSAVAARPTACTAG